MRGHIEKRKYKNQKGEKIESPNWTIVLELDKSSSGKRKQQWITVKGSKKDAEKRLSELLHQKDIGSYTKPGKLTVGDYLEQWLQDYCQARGSTANIVA